MAGGDASRLGIHKPKCTFSLELLKPLIILEEFIKRVRALSDEASIFNNSLANKSLITIVLIVSKDCKEIIEKLLLDNNNFDYPNIRLCYSEKESNAFNKEGSAALHGPAKIFKSSSGNGFVVKFF